MGFVHLHLHTPFSFLDGASRIDELVGRASELGMGALAMTDHNNLSAALRFLKACKKAGLKPILGAEVSLKWGSHLTLIAQNRRGYTNLGKILTQAWLGSDRKNPQADLSVISENRDGLIALSGCSQGEIAELILRRRFREAEEKAREYVGIFGRENFWLELQRTLSPWDRLLDSSLRELGEALGLNTVATNNVHYAEKGGFRVQDILTCIRTLTKLDQPHSERKLNGELYLKSAEQMRRLFSNYPGALRSSEEIAERCEDMDLRSSHGFPKFRELPEGETASGYLRKLTYRGAKLRYGKVGGKVKHRLDHELSVIESLGFSEYFLVVWDLVQFAKSRGIRHSGRGSAADSAVAYCLGLTSVDSIARDLRFERFINPERADNLPDIDLDFDARYRDEVLEWVTEKYGEDKVATVCTFSRYRARSALRDVGKALDLPEEEIDRLAKLMPWVEADEIREAIDRVPELRQSNIEVHKFSRLLDLCTQIADFPRHIGTHLGGIVISREPLVSVSPIQRSAKGCLILQFDKDDVEDLGLVKLDLLCLRMLSAVEDTVELIGSDGRFDWDGIPLDDEATYELLGSGETVGAFQLESPAQRSLQRRLKPDNIEDIVASVALIRPGPIQGDMVQPFVLRRRGEARVTYIHPKLERILRKTYGVVLFQEQVVEIAVEIAGFSPGEADLLRRAMTHHRSKKEMESIGKRFIGKALSHGIERRVAETVFSYIKGYAGYGFCEAHAASFGDTAYKTAYLLRHYPAQFYAAILSNQPMGFYPPHTIVTEAKRRGVRVLPLDVNLSEAGFTGGEGWMRVGLKQVKGIGEKVLESILEARPFSSLEDFLRRASTPRDVTEDLVLCGAFDGLGGNRRRLMWELGGIKKGSEEGCLPFCYKGEVSELEDYPDMQKLRFEWEILRFSPAKHIMELYRSSLRRWGVLTNSRIKGCKAGERVKVAGLVIRPHRPPTRSGRVVVFLSLEDETGLADVTIFEDVYKKYGKVIFSCPALMIEGVIDGRGGSSILAEKVSDLRAMEARME